MISTVKKAARFAPCLLLVAASAQGIEVLDSEAAFVARAGDVSTANFADASVPGEVFEPFVVIDEVRYEISSGRGATCFQTTEESCWQTIGGEGEKKLLSSAWFAVAMEEWAFGAGDWDVIRFGDRRSVKAFGFYFHSLLPGALRDTAIERGFSGWELLVHERDGTVTSVTVPPLSAGEPAYFGLVSDTGIWMIDVGSMPGPASFNWAYEAVSHSAIQEHESLAPVAMADAPPTPERAPRLDNERLERRGGLYYEARANSPATGMVELRHPGGQPYIRAYLEAGRKNGPETHWYANGQLASEMYYLNGRKTAPQREWHDNGEKRSSVAYYQGRIEGTAEWWHPNGEKEIEVVYRLGRREGIERRWYENGRLASESLYVFGAPEGASTLWYPNGQKQSVGSFTAGRRDGQFTSWHENGQKRSEVSYIHGKAEGLAVEWHENGRKSMEQELRDGKRVGRQTQWYEDGQLRAEINFADDKFHGRVSWYYPDGSREMEFHFEQGKLNGLGTQWYPNGQKKSEGEFRDGKAVGKHGFWDEKGKKLRRRPRDYPALPDVERIG